jgi:hypothetical protein
MVCQVSFARGTRGYLGLKENLFLFADVGRFTESNSACDALFGRSINVQAFAFGGDYFSKRRNSDWKVWVLFVVPSLLGIERRSLIV